MTVGMLTVLLAATAQAQAAARGIPIRSLAPMTASSNEPLGALVTVRGLSDGSVLVNDVSHKRVLKLDVGLAKVAVVIDSAGSARRSGVAAVPMSSATLIRYFADSTLYADVSSQSLLVLDRHGKVARVMSLPRPRDILYLAMGITNGLPTMDPQGRLVYRGEIVTASKPTMLPTPGDRRMFPVVDRPDSSPIVRADFDARTVDTLTTLKLRRWTRLTESTDTQGKTTTKMVLDPMATGDEWAMLSDGTIAIVRAHDYHIDWVDPNGKRRSTPKMPIDWRRVTDEEKKFKLDSMRALFERPSKSASAGTPSAPTSRVMQIGYRPIDSLGDYEPPIAPGAVRADFAGNLWVLPRTSSSARGGLLYDVINRLGEIVYRVQFPKGYSLVGFGDGGVLYALRVEGATGYLARTKAP